MIIYTNFGLTDGCVLRYNALIFWLYARPEMLDPRLDERVDVMLQVRLSYQI